MRGVHGQRRMVVSPSPVRPVRAHRLLRQLALAARERPLRRDRAPDHSKLRAWRGLVLERRDRAGGRGAAARAARAASCRPADTWSRRPRARGLAGQTALIRIGILADPLPALLTRRLL